MTEDRVATCPACGQPNRTEARFCDSCGQRLSSRGADLGLDPRTYTPAGLAERILRRGRDLEGERRTVTILFVDAVDSTPLAERLGEEKMYVLMQDCIARMMEAVHRYEGHVASFTGDGMMAIFGAPIAHEQPERRAVAAALRMQEALEAHGAEIQARHGVECRFRVGLNTGPVVIGKVSDALVMEFTAIGDTVNLAARVQSLAEAGTVYLTESTFRAAEAYFECETLGLRSVKGKGGSVQLFRARREKPWRTRFQAAVQRGLTPFVGREAELAVLEGHLDAVRSGTGRMVVVTGDAGLGKSRLLSEFRRQAAPGGINWVEGHCISYGRRIPFLPIIEVAKQAFGVSEGDGETTVIRRIEEATSGWDAAARATVPYLRFLLSVDPGDPAVATMDPRERRAGFLDALRSLVVELTRTRVLIMVLEDLHWADEATEQALAVLAGTVAHARALVLLSTRPGYGGTPDRPYAVPLVLAPLAEDESEGLVHGVLEAVPPAELQHLVSATAEGNPFFVEEVIRSLLETGTLARSNGDYRLLRPASEIHIPGSIQEIVLTRIDRLDRGTKATMQLASVIGREFTLRLLERISEAEAELGDALGVLQELELIYERGDLPELAYMFKHAVTHDVAYSTLLADRREALHRGVAAAVEGLYADRLAEQYETLAHHYERGRDWLKALDYLARAGDKAAAAYANQDALDYYGRALVVCEQVGDDVLTEVASLARRRGLVSFAISCFTDAARDFELWAEAAHRLGDAELEGTALAYRGLAELFEHDKEKAEATLQASLALGEAGGFRQLQAMASFQLAHLYVSWDRHADAVPFLRFVDEHADDLTEPFTRAFWSWYASRVELWSGRLDVAVRRAEADRPVTERVVFHRMASQWNEAHARATRGEYEAALRLLHEALATSERLGDIILRVRALNTVGFVYAELGDLEQAETWNRRSLEVVLAAGIPVPEAEMNARLNLVENCLATDRVSEALEHLRVVEEVVRHPQPRTDFMRWRYGQRFLHDAGEYWLGLGDRQQASTLAAECLEWAQRTGSRKNIVKGWRLQGQVLLAGDFLDEAEAELRRAVELAQEVGSPSQLRETLVVLGDVEMAQGHLQAAVWSWEEALGIVDAVSATLQDRHLAEVYLDSRPVAALRRRIGAENVRRRRRPGG